MVWDEQSHRQLQEPPLSAADHRACGLAVFPVPAEPALVEEMLLERGIVVSYETIRRWGRKFGPAYAKQLRRKKPSREDIWHLDEVVISVAGTKHWLWRAVDQEGYVLDEIVQACRDTKAAKRLLIRLLKSRAWRRSGSSLISCAHMERQDGPSCPLSNIARTRA